MGYCTLDEMNKTNQIYHDTKWDKILLEPLAPRLSVCKVTDYSGINLT